MSTDTKPAAGTSYASLVETMQGIQDLRGAMSILEWDQETMMPRNAAPIRARQMSTLAGLVHERMSSSAPASAAGGGGTSAERDAGGNGIVRVGCSSRRLTERISVRAALP